MNALDEVLSGLKTKKNSMVSRVEYLKTKEHASEAKTKAARAITKVQDLFGSGPSVDSVSERIEQQAATADASLRRSMANAGEAMGKDAVMAEASARLAARKARLKGGAESK